VTNKRRETIKKLAHLMHVINYVLNFKIKIDSTSRKIPCGMPEWIPERQIFHRSIV
jgi:hypothetical protein